jgi:hypothetical protein
LSQYPPPPYSPYNPPPQQQQQPNLGFDYYQPGVAAAQDPLAPARRASVLMFIIGGLVLLCGGCLALSGQLVSVAQFPPEQAQVIQQFESQYKTSFQSAMIAFGVILLVLGLAYVLLGVFVRRGGMGSAVTSIVLTSLVSIFLLLEILSAFIGPMAGPQAMAGACVFALALGAFVLLLGWLAQAVKASRYVAAARQHYQAQYLQYYQQQQAYSQGAYGYPAQQAPPAGGYNYGYPPGAGSGPPPPGQPPRGPAPDNRPPEQDRGNPM